MKHIASMALAVSLACVLPGHATAAPAPALGVSGYMIPNADGTASFEFRVANDRPDITVTGFTVTVAFYDRTIKAENKLAEYHWSFLSEVPPNQQLLEYGVLDAEKVADLKKRHATGHASADSLSTAVYTYEVKVDSQAAPAH